MSKRSTRSYIQVEAKNIFDIIIKVAKLFQKGKGHIFYSRRVIFLGDHLLPKKNSRSINYIQLFWR